MKRNRTAISLVTAAAAVLLAGCGSGGPVESTTTSTASTSTASASPTPPPTTTASPSGSRTTGSASSSAASSGGAAADGAELEQHCTQSGGQVQTRSPYWNTNGDQSQWLALAGSATMCRFQADDEARSRIYVDLATLGSTSPTLAGLAYLSKVPMPSSTGGANPATGYCSDELHGSSSFGGGAAGGGWVTTDPDDVVVSLCVFPDGSFIDEWGLAYHSAGDIRGKDLTTVMRYQPSGALPPVFPAPQVQPTS